MGIDKDFSSAYAKASIAAGLQLPTSGTVFITMIDKFKDAIVPVAQQLKVTLLSPLTTSEALLAVCALPSLLLCRIKGLCRSTIASLHAA